MTSIEDLRIVISIVAQDVPRILADVAAGRAHPSQGTFIVNRLASLQDQLAEQLEAERAIIVVDIIPQPVEFTEQPIIITEPIDIQPITQTPRIDTKTIIALVALGVLIL